MSRVTKPAEPRGDTSMTPRTEAPVAPAAAGAQGRAQSRTDREARAVARAVAERPDHDSSDATLRLRRGGRGRLTVHPSATEFDGPTDPAAARSPNECHRPTDPAAARRASTDGRAELLDRRVPVVRGR